MHGLQGSIRAFGETNPQAFKPGQDFRGLADQGIYQVRIVLEMSTAKHIQVVIIRRVLPCLGGSLYASLGHHRIGITVAKLGDQYHLSPLFLS